MQQTMLKKKEDAKKSVGKQSYTVLLIMTDGAVTDLEETKEAIRKASSSPLSIVIVGIGDADFSQMQTLVDLQANDMVDVIEILSNSSSSTSI